MYISIKQAVGVYAELVEAKHNVNGFGGNVAEIYAYRFMPHRPSFDPNKICPEDAINAAKSLVDIIDLFVENYGRVDVLIDGMERNEWLKNIGDGFNHKVNIEVKAKK